MAVKVAANEHNKIIKPCKSSSIIYLLTEQNRTGHDRRHWRGDRQTDRHLLIRWWQHKFSAKAVIQTAQNRSKLKIKKCAKMMMSSLVHFQQGSKARKRFTFTLTGHYILPLRLSRWEVCAHDCDERVCAMNGRKAMMKGQMGQTRAQTGKCSLPKACHHSHHRHCHCCTPPFNPLCQLIWKREMEKREHTWSQLWWKQLH